MDKVDKTLLRLHKSIAKKTGEKKDTHYPTKENNWLYDEIKTRENVMLFSRLIELTTLTLNFCTKKRKMIFSSLVKEIHPRNNEKNDICNVKNGN